MDSNKKEVIDEKSGNYKTELEDAQDKIRKLEEKLAVLVDGEHCQLLMVLSLLLMIRYGHTSLLSWNQV